MQHWLLNVVVFIFSIPRIFMFKSPSTTTSHPCEYWGEIPHCTHVFSQLCMPSFFKILPGHRTCCMIDSMHTGWIYRSRYIWKFPKQSFWNNSSMDFVADTSNQSSWNQKYRRYCFWNKKFQRLWPIHHHQNKFQRLLWLVEIYNLSGTSYNYMWNSFLEH